MLPKDNYQDTLKDLKEKIRKARSKVALSINSHLIAIYWEIGNTIKEQQKTEGWGAKVIEKLAIDLRIEFSEMKGLSARNLQYMRTFVDAYPRFSITQPMVAQLKSNEIQDITFTQPMVAQIPWTHHTVILNKAKTEEERLFYISKTIENGWSKSVLALQIDSNLYQRQGQAITNFSATLPAPQSDLAKETLKNPYVFDFLSFEEDIQEKELEKGLIQHLKKFMLELGRGFAYVGNQKNLNVQGDDFFLDLLFYNYHLHCFVVFELKVGDFKPEFVGKLNFYTNTVNEQLKGKEDKPTIGVLLCRTPNETVIQYSLKAIDSPIGVAEYELSKALPKQLKGEMPTVEELEQEIQKEIEHLQKPLDKKLQKIAQLTEKLNADKVVERQSKENTVKIVTTIINPLCNKIKTDLKEIINQFDSCELLIWAYGQGHQDDTEILKKLGQFHICSDFRISLRLSGYKNAGTKSFYASEEIDIKMEDYKYYCKINKLQSEIVWEKLYHQFPSEEEINKVIELFGENISDYIISQLERITKEK